MSRPTTLFWSAFLLTLLVGFTMIGGFLLVVARWLGYY
jgi:hypothetical protein